MSTLFVFLSLAYLSLACHKVNQTVQTKPKKWLCIQRRLQSAWASAYFDKGIHGLLHEMKKVNKQCLLDTPRTVRVSEKTWQVIVRTRRP